MQAVRQGVPVETEPETAHPRGPVRQGAAARVSPVRHELQAHQPPEQARDTLSAHRVRRQSRDRRRRRRHVVRVRVVVHVVRVHRAAHTETTAAVPGRGAHHRRVRRHDVRRAVPVADHTGVALEKPEFGPELEFQNPKTGQLGPAIPKNGRLCADPYENQNITFVIITNART